MKTLVTLLLLCLTLLANDLVNVTLSQFASRVSKQVNENIYIDEDVNSSISLYVPDKITNHDIVNLFKNSLRKKGFYLVKIGNSYFLKKIKSILKTPHLYRLKYSSFKDVNFLLQNLQVKNQYLKDLNAFVITTDKKSYKKITTLLSLVDIRQSQVKIKIMIFEYQSNLINDVGVQLGSVYKDITQTTKYALNSIIASVSSNGILLSSNAFYSALHLLNSKGYINVKQYPFIITKNNCKFKFSAVTNVPYLVSTTTTEATNKSEQNQIVYKDIGLEISGVPLVHKKYISLDLNLLVQDFINDNITQTPSTYKRVLHSSINIPFKKILIISGLKRNKLDDNDYSVPYLSNIPYLGKVFQYHRKTHSEINLTIAIQVIQQDKKFGL